MLIYTLVLCHFTDQVQADDDVSTSLANCQILSIEVSIRICASLGTLVNVHLCLLSVADEAQKLAVLGGYH